MARATGQSLLKPPVYERLHSALCQGKGQPARICFCVSYELGNRLEWNGWMNGNDERGPGGMRADDARLRPFFWLISDKLDLVHGMQFCTTVGPQAFQSALTVDMDKLERLFLMLNAHF